MSNNGHAGKPARLLTYLTGKPSSLPPLLPETRPVIGVLEGTGIGPQVIGSALQVLAAIEQVLPVKFEIERGGLIGDAALAEHGQWLPEDTVAFCARIFDRGGAILNGPGGGRYVYDLRRQFNLFCKFAPIRPWPELASAGKIVPQHVRDIDILIVRDNIGGVYQGQWNERTTSVGRIAEHSFVYDESQVRQLIEVAARATADRRGLMHVILKDGGVPTMSTLWRDVGNDVAQKHGIKAEFMNVDLAAYEIIQNPARFDVIVTPNLFGDILVDITGVLVASRGVTFSGNYDAQGRGVYQTNHGCGHDLAGTDTANPAGQIISLAMLLRESFGLDQAATLMETSLAEVWRQGWRTADIAEPGCKIIGTKAMADRIAHQVLQSKETRQPNETCAVAR